MSILEQTNFCTCFVNGLNSDCLLREQKNKNPLLHYETQIQLSFGEWGGGGSISRSLGRGSDVAEGLVLPPNLMTFDQHGWH
jgi:hypothetical protein